MCVYRHFHWKHSDTDEVSLWHCLAHAGDKVEEFHLRLSSKRNHTSEVSSFLNEVINSLSISVADKICFLALPLWGLSVQVWVSVLFVASPFYSAHTPFSSEKGLWPDILKGRDSHFHSHIPLCSKAAFAPSLSFQEDLGQGLGHSTTPLPPRWKGPYSTA